jgi:hypothetical protein
MKPTRHTVVQGTDEWLRLRLGIPTASNFHKLKPLEKKTKSGAAGELSRLGKDYLYRLICERLMDDPVKDEYLSRAMKYGIAHESEAANEFAQRYKFELVDGGFIEAKLNGLRIGCSPDRLIKRNIDAAAEIKCPESHTHIRYIIEGPEDDYLMQVQGQMFVGEFDRVFFYSWHQSPRVPNVMKVFTPIKDTLAQLREWLLYFCDELEAKTEVARNYGLRVNLYGDEPRLEES